MNYWTKEVKVILQSRESLLDFRRRGGYCPIHLLHSHQVMSHIGLSHLTIESQLHQVPPSLPHQILQIYLRNLQALSLSLLSLSLSLLITHKNIHTFTHVHIHTHTHRCLPCFYTPGYYCKHKHFPTATTSTS